MTGLGAWGLGGGLRKEAGKRRGVGLAQTLGRAGKGNKQAQKSPT